jgi:hypothetical protein
MSISADVHPWGDFSLLTAPPPEWILYTGLLPVLAWRGEISQVAPKSIYIAAGLGIKKISFPFSFHHSPYNTGRLSTKGESAISLMQ